MGEGGCGCPFLDAIISGMTAFRAKSGTIFRTPHLGLSAMPHAQNTEEFWGQNTHPPKNIVGSDDEI